MGRPDRYFRAGVGAVIFNARRQVLVLERTDVPGAWQFPQGGLDKGEAPVEGARREAEEETGIPAKALRLVGRYPDLLAYELPERAQTKRTGLGQVQYWFYFETRAVDVPLEALPPGEFRAARWVSFERAVAGSVAFRAALYKKLRMYARTLPRRTKRT